MYENGYITEEEMKDAQAKPLKVNPRPFGAQLFAAEVLRRGSAPRTVADVWQGQARQGRPFGPHHARSKTADLCAAGAGARPDRISTASAASAARSRRSISQGDWGAVARKPCKVPADVAPWRLAVVLEVERRARRPSAFSRNCSPTASRRASAKPAHSRWSSWPGRGPMSMARSSARRSRRPTDVLAPGDVIYVAPSQR